MSANSPVVKQWVKRFSVSMAILAAGLIVGLLVINPQPAETQSATVATENGDSLVAPAERGADFDFVDHELRYAGRYGLVAPPERGAVSDFVDHELRYAGGYGLVALAERGAVTDFVDHELRYAGSYGLVAQAERGTGFDFVDHELRYAGRYGLVAPAQKVSASSVQ